MRAPGSHLGALCLAPWRPAAFSAYDATPNATSTICLQSSTNMRLYCRFAVAMTAAAACSGRDPQRAAADSLVRAPAPPTVAAPAGKAKCPADGQWSECAVFDRLDQAGLAPRRDTSVKSIDLAPLKQRGTRLLVGNAELDVFIYPDSGHRAQDEASLDRSKYIEASAEPTLRGEATLIRNVNLLGVLRSRNDHQRERVSDALSAGPPQPPRAVRLPDTRAR